ncbi:glycoside hydrolase family 88 protein [Ceratobasidium sp. AG-Ba]|nr:glycoside hydrolase family 88 protein [Ceratobasidium sp. AG-Ba]
MRLSAVLVAATILPLSLAQAPTYSDSIFSPAIAQKYARVGANYRKGEFPHVTDTAGKWQWTKADWWTSGFLPSSFYLLHERSKLCPTHKDLTSVDWLALARRWSDSVAPLQYSNSRGHDQGFLSYPFMYELEVNPNNQTAATAVNNFAGRLAARYNKVVGCTRSWSGTTGGVTVPNGPDFLVIIDNMMNLEVLERSKQLTGNKTLESIAISHSNKTMVNHLRSDASSYHVVDYNVNTGKVIFKGTWQGYTNSSTWTRGQAWGIHGFATMYSYTKQTQFLTTSRRMADLFIARTPSSGIIPWDFDAPSASKLADTSAAAAAAQGMFVLADGLSSVPGDADGAKYYRQKAVKLMTDTFKFAFKSSQSWDSILSNGTSNNPSGVKNTGIVYGDYFALKAGNSMLKLGLASC